MCDIDYGKITMFIGNYDFWYESSELALKQMKESNRKKEEKIKELQAFIAKILSKCLKKQTSYFKKENVRKD